MQVSKDVWWGQLSQDSRSSQQGMAEMLPGPSEAQRATAQLAVSELSSEQRALVLAAMKPWVQDWFLYRSPKQSGVTA